MSDHFLPIDAELAWFDEISYNGMPAPCGKYQILSNVTPNRIIHSRKTEDGQQWLMQSGEGAGARFAWVSPALVVAESTAADLNLKARQLDCLVNHFEQQLLQ